MRFLNIASSDSKVPNFRMLFPASVRRSHQPRYPEHIQLDAVDAHPGSTSEYEGAGIPLQYDQGLFPGPGGIYTNGIRHSPKRDDVRSTARVSARTAVVEYHLRRHPEGGSCIGCKCHLLCG